MTTLTANIENDNDLPILKEILNRFGINYKIDRGTSLNTNEEILYERLKESFSEIKNWNEDKIRLQNANEAIAEIESELNDGV